MGAYEQVRGTVAGELDPSDPLNAVITDIELAPRNAHGRVTYTATFTMLKPMDMSCYLITLQSGSTLADGGFNGFGGSSSGPVQVTAGSTATVLIDVTGF